jgi:phage terminase Nu1 subunit (DNA packaging protein)
MTSAGGAKGAIPESRLMNKGEIARFFGVSMNTVGDWIRRGMPYIEKGTGRRVPWVIDALEVAEWWLEQRSGARSQSVPDPANNVNMMTPQDRKAWYESEAKRLALDEQSRQLIPVAEVEQVIATSFAAIAQGLQGLPDTVERRTGCDPSLVQAIQEVVEAEMDSLADKLSALGPTELES